MFLGLNTVRRFATRGVTTIAGAGCIGVTAPMIGTVMPHTDCRDTLP